MKSYLFILIALISGCQAQDPVKNETAQEQPKPMPKQARISVEECDGPDVDMECMFLDCPDVPGRVLQIVDEAEVNLVLAGKILNAESRKPVEGVNIYAYHTNEAGIYEKKGDERGAQKWHGYLHGWSQTDSRGNYEIRTLRPAPYPAGDIPAHIHIYLQLPSGEIFFINDMVFAGDINVNEAYSRSLENAHNPPKLDDGVIVLRAVDGIEYGFRDILILN
jgi:protocatechuate 3,4-dioxygenase beta subunit